MFTLNNVFLCLNRLGVKFFQISGSTLQLQRHRTRFTVVGRGAKPGSVWAPPASRISSRWMESCERWLSGLHARERFVVVSARGSELCLSHFPPQRAKVSFPLSKHSRE